MAITATDRNQIIKIAKLFLDTPYEFGGMGCYPGEGTDCSRFTQIVLENVGIKLERNSAQQGQQFSKSGFMYTTITKAEKGDLIFFKKTYESENEITHVAIFIGNNQILHATTDKVKIENISSYWKSHFKGVGSLKCFAKDYNKTLATQNYEKLSKGNRTTTNSENGNNSGNNNTSTQPTDPETLKAVNAVIAVLTSTRGDMTKNNQETSAAYAKSLREQYPDARKLENIQAKKVYQSVVDILSYARKFAGKTEQKKYSDLTNYLRKQFGLQ